MDACQDENALLRFSASAAETQVRKYDLFAADNITQNRRLQIQQLHEKVRKSQDELEQRVQDAAIINSKRLKVLFNKSKTEYDQKVRESTATFNEFEKLTQKLCQMPE